VADAPVSAE